MRELHREDSYITITREEYEELRSEVKWLRCLEAAGVGNWEGYNFALDLGEEDVSEQEQMFVFQQEEK